MNRDQLKIIVIGVSLSALLWLIAQSARDVPLPEPTPEPIHAGKISVLIVEETDDRDDLPFSQSEVLAAGTIRDYLDSHCDEWRVFDQDVNTKNESAKWQEAMQRKRDSLPWVLISNGTQGTEGPLPETVDDALSLFRKWGGE